MTKGDDLRNRLLMTYAYEETQIASKHLLLTHVVTLLVKRPFTNNFSNFEGTHNFTMDLAQGVELTQVEIFTAELAQGIEVY